jgi:hypothetical protein
MGLTREVPVNATDAIELVDQLITRAALQASDGKIDIVTMLMNFHFIYKNDYYVCML